MHQVRERLPRPGRDLAAIRRHRKRQAHQPDPATIKLIAEFRRGLNPCIVWAARCVSTGPRKCQAAGHRHSAVLLCDHSQ